MRIIEINIFQCNTPFKFSFHSPHLQRIQADSIVVKLRFNNGILEDMGKVLQDPM